MAHEFPRVLILLSFLVSLISPSFSVVQATEFGFGLSLPEPGKMVALSPAYKPVTMQGLTLHPENPFLFDFIVDTGESRLSPEQLKKEGQQLISYFYFLVFETAW